MLKKALLKLLKEKDISQISIYELCQTAEINRSTFYKYYGNQYDLLAEIESDFCSGLEANLQTKGPADIDMLAYALSFLNDEREVFKILVNSSPDNSFTYRLFQRPLLAGILEGEIVRNFTSSEREFASLFFSQGIYAIVRKWLNSENPESPKEIAKLILSLRGKFE